MKELREADDCRETEGDRKRAAAVLNMRRLRWLQLSPERKLFVVLLSL
jgi:hypothetical protein